MVRIVEPRRIDDLITLLDGLCELQEKLIELIRVKMDAMRRADVAKLRTLHDEERALAKRLQARETLRRDLMMGIGEELGFSENRARNMTVSQVVAHLSEITGGRLVDVATRLRHTAGKTAKANRVAGAVARETINHLRWVFAAIRPEDDTPVGYSGQGAVTGPQQTRIFETLG
jgi:hypothetical protein